MISQQDLDSPIIKAFRQKGYKATPQRIAIGRFMLHSHEHPTARRIYNEVRKVYPTVSLATIYTTIQILKDVDLIQELNLHAGQARFDPNTEPHAHLVCSQCGSISDWIDPLIQKLVAKISAEASFIVNRSNLDVNGVCKSCDKKTKAITLYTEISAHGSDILIFS